MKTTVYTHDSFLKHDTGFSHPERPERLETVLSLLKEAPFSDLPIKQANAASEEQLLLAHQYNYISRLLDAIPDRGHVKIDHDTILSPHTWTAAVHAAGSVCDAVDDIASGATDRAFCAVRPPGHHAEPHRSMGFCFFNSIFVGARHAQVAHGFNKIAIVDFDVHHGNGTDIMARQHDGSILYVSTHQYPLFPMTGLEEDNDDTVINFTLPEGANSQEFREIYERQIFPALEDFAPDLLMISAGFDAHTLDPFAGIDLGDEDFFWITEKLSAIADKHCHGKIVSVLEGGYNLDALATSVAAHLKALAKI